MIMNNIKIKFFSDFTNEEFQQIFRKYYAEEEKIILKPDTTIFDEMQKKYDEGKEHAFIIEKNGKMVAFILGRKYRLEAPGKFIAQTIGFIEELYVLPEERNQKFATRLIQESCNYFLKNNITKVVLTTEEHNYKFYQKMGYEIDKTYECANKLSVFSKDIEREM